MPLKLKSKGIAAHFGECEFHSSRDCHEGASPIDDRATRIGEAEKFSYFVEGFAGCVVASLAQEFVCAGFGQFEEMSVAAADNKS